MRRLDPREERLLALFLLLAALALGWLLLVRPVADGFVARAQRREALQFTYLRDERVIGQLRSIGRAAAGQRRAAARFRIPAADAPAAAAWLKARLGEAVAASGGQVRAVEDVSAASGRAGVRLQCALTAPQLAILLRRIQAAAPLLMVDALVIGANKEEQPPLPSGLLETSLDVSAAYASAPPR